MNKFSKYKDRLIHFLLTLNHHPTDGLVAHTLEQKFKRKSINSEKNQTKIQKHIQNKEDYETQIHSILCRHTINLPLNQGATHSHRKTKIFPKAHNIKLFFSKNLL